MGHVPYSQICRLTSSKIKAYSPFCGKKYETLSYLPELSDTEIYHQLNYMIKSGWTPCLEFSDSGDIFLNTNMGPGYYDNRYWSMYKLPMFGCKDAAEAIREIEECKFHFPHAKLRIIGFDAKKQVQSAGFIVKK